MLDRTIHVQVLTNITSTNNIEITNGSSNIISRAVDGRSCDGSLDFKVMGLNINNENFKVFLYAATEPHQIKDIKYHFIFLKNISDISNTRIKLNDKGLSVPAVAMGLHGFREINPRDEVVLVIGGAFFLPEEIEAAKKYAEENQLFYAGECSLTNSDAFSKTMEDLVTKVIEIENNKEMENKNKQKQKAAFRRGAAAGAFKDILPMEIGLHIGGFLSEGYIALTRKSAMETALGELEEEKEKLNRLRK